MSNEQVPRCPVCGEEMTFGNALKSWECFYYTSTHAFVGPANDPTGEKTIAMIAEIRQEARIAELESQVVSLIAVQQRIEKALTEVGLPDEDIPTPELIRRHFGKMRADCDALERFRRMCETEEHSEAALCFGYGEFAGTVYIVYCDYYSDVYEGSTISEAIDAAEKGGA